MTRERAFAHGANTVSNLCNMTIDLTACYVDGSSCFEYGVPPLRQELLAPQSVIDGHGGLRFYPCLRGYDAVSASGQRITRVSATYRCAAETARDTAPPCAVPDGPALVVVVAPPDYPSDTGESAQVIVDVSLDETGAILGTTFTHPARSDSINRDAMRVVRGSLYSPKIVACSGVPTHYKYIIDYNVM